jgi:hypothetical protein
MKFWYIFFGYCICFLITGWGFNLISTEVHEQAHVAIFKNYNISSNFTINWWTGSGATYPDTKTYYLYCDDSCKMAHSLNEIIGYNINTLIFAIMCTAFIVGLIMIMIINMKSLEDRDEKYEKIIDDLIEKLKEKNNGGEEPFVELSDLTGETAKL